MKKILLSVAVVALFAVRVNADVLAGYPFTGSSRASTDTDANTSASSIADGAGLTPSFDVIRGNAAPSLAVVSTDTAGANQGEAVTNNEYISFTLTPLSGATFSLSSLTFDYANYTNDTTFPTENFFARSSVGSFASNLAGAVTASVASAGTFATASITLGAAFQNLTAPIEFRIYFQDGTTDPDRGALVDNITLNGTTIAGAVPEPATWMLMGAGLLLGAQRLRRKS